MEKQIWDFLISKGFNAFAVAGIMANLFAESGLKPTNVQDSSGKSDAAYTAAVDNGSYLNFIKDMIGYGLAQWTDPYRKEKMYNFIKTKNTSIGDLISQLEYLVYELQTDFKTVYNGLLKATSVQEASTLVLLKFEKPANAASKIQERAGYGLNYYNKYKEGSTVMALLKKGSVGPEVETLQNNLIKLGYSCGPDGADGDFGNATVAAVIEFQTDFSLEIDGKVGQETQTKIAALLADPNYKKPNTKKKYAAAALIAIASAEVGYREKKSNSNLDNKTANAGSSNFTKYARDLAQKGYYGGSSKQGFAWCDVFVDWCFLQLCGGNAAVAQNIQCQTGPYGAGCTYSAQYFKQQGRWSTKPALGAQIFFYVNGAINHTGIVTAINGSTITTIEGNTSEQVATRTYNTSNGTIAGYGLPKFTENEPEEEIKNEVQNTFTPYKVKITAKKLNVRAEPSMDAPVVKILVQGDIKEIIGEQNSFGKLAGDEGWIMLAYTKI